MTPYTPYTAAQAKAAARTKRFADAAPLIEPLLPLIQQAAERGAGSLEVPDLYSHQDTLLVCQGLDDLGYRTAARMAGSSRMEELHGKEWWRAGHWFEITVSWL